jgi:hypothetical protein
MTMSDDILKSIAADYVQQWQTLAMSSTGDHLTLSVCLPLSLSNKRAEMFFS